MERDRHCGWSSLYDGWEVARSCFELLPSSWPAGVLREVALAVEDVQELLLVHGVRAEVNNVPRIKRRGPGVVQAELVQDVEVGHNNVDPKPELEGGSECSGDDAGVLSDAVAV